MKKIRSAFRRLFISGFFQYALVLNVIFLTIMLVIFFAERETNPNIRNFFDVLWYALVTITTVGYGDISPGTFTGRIAGIGLLLFGVISFAAISGKVASILFDQQLKKDRGLIYLKKISNHFIICGWKQGFDRILDGILVSNPDMPLDKIVLINTAASERMDKIKSETRFRGIHYLHGDYTDEAILIRANVKSAERVLVLADYSQNFSPLEMDSRTVLTILTIKGLNPKIYTVAELIDSKFERHLEVAHCDEIILTSDYERSLLVSASSGIGLSHVLKELLTDVAGEGLFIEDMDPSFFGKTYLEYRRSLSDKKKVLIGVLENTGNFYHRRREALNEAQKNPDMQKIVENLKKVKKLKSNAPVLAPPENYIIGHSSKGIFVCGSQRKGEQGETNNSATVQLKEASYVQFS